ncbi:MAG TPA: alpha-amylase family glycosyl hydrolase [Bacteroidales bacterium]|nr:alpha-amylase family glycosyl hydrolase [Bacteroidales bacterium]HRZ49519.1 alpha-amylase family glycosyl hydrolase [Bacteroidales bacterium]
MKESLLPLWHRIYGTGHDQILSDFIAETESFKLHYQYGNPPPEWYKDVVVYSLYVDLFNKDLAGLDEKLDYLAEVGISCLWLLPILDSPMRDAGFDIRDYRKIRHDLLPAENQADAFAGFVEKAHSKGIRIIFDIALNHTSEEHPWFAEARKSKDNPYRDYYIWSDTDKPYSQARIIFQGIETSNWKKEGDQYFFHRFFDFQPDLNYRNPLVIIEMIRNMLYWLNLGVDGFRADAIPYLWKQEDTDCENLETTHDIVKFIRAVLDEVRPNTLLLAEACQKPAEVVRYFGTGDECNAGYHFPLMPQLFKSIAMGSREPVMHILDPSVTPAPPANAQWFTFLRCHDELSLELVYVSEEDRAYIHQQYCRQPLWNFREGQGISARLAELMDRDPQKIGLAFSMMLSLPGTPVIYYGDEFGKLNDEAYYSEQIRLVGKDDTRFLVRGRIDWDALKTAFRDDHSPESRVITQVISMLRARNQYKCFGRGDLKWLQPEVTPAEHAHAVLAFERTWQNEHIIILHNLSPHTVTITLPELEPKTIHPFGYQWIVVE